MDNSDWFTDILAPIATKEAALSELRNVKETLQNEVAAQQEELERIQGVKRKQQEKHTQSKAVLTSAKKRYDGWLAFYIQRPL